MADRRIFRLTRRVAAQDQGIIVPFDHNTTVSPFFPVDWSQPISLSSTWSTAISSSNDELIEERMGHWSRPQLSVNCQMAALDRREVSMLRHFLECATQSTNRIPIYPDGMILTKGAAFDPEGTFIECETDSRHLFVGQQVGLARPDGSSWSLPSGLTGYLLGIVMDIRFDGVTVFFTEDPTSIPVDCVLFPMIDCNALDQTSGKAMTDTALVLQTKFTQLFGQCSLPPSWRGEINELEPYYLGLPVFEVPVNWADNIDFGVSRVVDAQDLGPFTVSRLLGQRGQFNFGFNHLASSREEAWRLLRLFDSRCGRLYPLWVPDPMTYFDASYRSSQSIVMSAEFPRQLLVDSLKNLKLEFVGVEPQYVGVESIVAAGSLYIINLDQPVNGAVSRVSVLRYSRFDRDTLEQHWQTDGVVTAASAFLELPLPEAVVVG